MTVRTFLLPDLGEGLTEADIVRWLVAEGDTVVVDQPIVEVETAKSLVEVPSPFGGTVATLHAAAGTTLDVGRPLVSVEDGVDAGGPGGGAAGAAGAASGGGAAGPAANPTDADWAGAHAREVAQSYAEEERAGAQPEAAAEAGVVAAGESGAGGSGGSGEADDGGSGNVLIGYGTPGGAAKGRTRRRKGAAPGGAAGGVSGGGQAGDGPRTHAAVSAAAEAPATATAAVSSTGGPAAGGAPGASGAEGAERQAPRVVNPLVRRLAREHGVDLAAVRGSGPGGLVMRADVLAAVGTSGAEVGPQGGGGTAEASAASAAAAPVAGEAALAAPTAAPSPGVPGAGAAGEVDARTGLAVAGVERVTGVRKATAAAMSRSRREIPEATVWVDVDVTPLMDLRAGMKARGDEDVPGVLAFASRFALAGLARYPALAQRFEEDGEGGHRIVSFEGINLGVAVQSDRGLVVPSIRGAHRMSARQLQAELRRVTELARSGRGTPQELSGGTFTINNYGIFGTDGSAAIINHPEVAILGMGRIIDRPWVVDGQLAVRKVMQLSLVFDHRVCDGGVAGGFLRFVADCFENPVALLAEV
ncbi:2-oxo acid dehydrogenase subunit E2 [Citricoccus sp. SGAir0253]|uniref:dihydrolipoamide acetyltransferase family protein n=1 Tax=Citricoccus sp. SGAir0253 TaxID=2567881 RepID=UPI0010CCC957|nr:dihydrolipoamide acetyltransferase family protein [Citricoccus sp. SGAir0253]QCU78951.1 2-oxo acid dehydrogenase subunit E2 [Citricoccus sp. SGAir0253]